MKQSGKTKNLAYERTKRWRKKHPEQYREYMKHYMRERRAKGL